MLNEEQKMSYAYGCWLKMSNLAGVEKCISDENVRKTLSRILTFSLNEEEIRNHVTGFVWGLMKCERLFKDIH